MLLVVSPSKSVNIFRKAGYCSEHVLQAAAAGATTLPGVFKGLHVRRGVP